MRSGVLRSLGVITTAAVVVATIGASGQASAGPASKTIAEGTTPRVRPLGVYPGNNGAAGAASFGKFEGTAVHWITAYLTGGSEWSAVDHPQWYLQQWAGSDYQVDWSVPIICQSGETLKAGAAGAYNKHFLKMGEAFVAAGRGDAVLRLGWEFGGGYMPWSAGSDPAAFAAYWRQIVKTLRSIPGQSFRFDWNGGGGSNWDVADAYPGNAYVDYVTADVFDQSWDPATGYGHNTATKAGYAQAWSDWLTNLDWLASFGKEHGKLLGFPEWGLIIRSDGHGGGDDPYFIQHMYDWMGTHNVTYEMYYDTNNTGSGESMIQDGSFPRAAGVFKRLFGDGIT